METIKERRLSDVIKNLKQFRQKFFNYAFKKKKGERKGKKLLDNFYTLKPLGKS